MKLRNRIFFPQVLHLIVLVAVAYGEYTKGLTGKFPKLEDIEAAAEVASGLEARAAKLLSGLGKAIIGPLLC